LAQPFITLARGTAKDAEKRQLANDHGCSLLRIV
jgi:hypothetical protein